MTRENAIQFKILNKTSQIYVSFKLASFYNNYDKQILYISSLFQKLVLCCRDYIGKEKNSNICIFNVTRDVKCRFLCSKIQNPCIVYFCKMLEEYTLHLNEMEY